MNQNETPRDSVPRTPRRSMPLVAPTSASVRKIHYAWVLRRLRYRAASNFDIEPIISD